MNARHTNDGFGEAELAALNASADSTLLQDAADWEDANIDAGMECATFGESQARGWTSGTYD